MSLTAISQYASTTGSVVRITRSAPAREPAKPVVRSLASGQVLHGNGLTQELNAQAKSSLNVEYDRLTRQSDIGAVASDKSSPSHGSFLASYVQNSSADSSTQSLGTLFKSSA